MPYPYIVEVRQNQVHEIAELSEALATGVIVAANRYELPPLPWHAPIESAATSLCRQLETTVFGPLTAAVSDDSFRTLRAAKFQSYHHLSAALPSAQPPAIDAAFSRFYEMVEADSLIPWHEIVGGREETRFCAETLQRACAIVASFGESRAINPRDRGLAGQFTLASLWTQFHISLLIFAIRNRGPLSPGLLRESVVGLRAAVVAYSSARQGYDLRATKEQELLPDVWDDQDQETVRIATRLGLEAQMPT